MRIRIADRDGIEVDKELRRLLPLKTKAEYEPDGVAAGVAMKAVERAEMCGNCSRCCGHWSVIG